MNSEHNPRLTSAEIAALWTQYMSQSAAFCFNNFMIQHIEDTDIRTVFEYAIHLSTKHLESIKIFLSNDGFPIPVGFTDNDVNIEAPQLFSDIFCLHYLNIMSIHGCHGYSGAVTTSTRQDVRDYFTECNASAVELCNRTQNILLEKGVYFRPPVISAPEEIDFVKNEQFLAGWFGHQRPLNYIEITSILFNLKKSILAKALMVAFNQVASVKKVKDILMEAINKKENHISMFNELLNKENLPSPPTLESEITESTTSPFSEKLMLFQANFLFSTAIVYYGTGLAVTQRRDIIPLYMKAIADDMNFENDCTELMINNGCLEQAPLTADRKELSLANK